MLRWCHVMLVVCLAVPSLHSQEIDDELLELELLGGADTPEHYEKHLEPLLAGINKATKLVVYEGLPHQQREPKALARELKNKKTIKLHKFPFYAAPIPLDDKVVEQLSTLCKAKKTFGRYRGLKLCGAYHPDWCLQFESDGNVYRVLLCFGCAESRLYGPKNELFTDVGCKTMKAFQAILVPLQKHRPEPNILEELEELLKNYPDALEDLNELREAYRREKR